jgi:hypothetical protein
MNSRKSLLWLCGLLLACGGFAHGQQVNPNKLPLCPKPNKTKVSDVERIAHWNNCWGKYLVEVDKSHKGDVLEGEWITGLLSGSGIFTSKTGDKYVGDYLNGKQHGVGTYTYASGSKYEGGYKNDLKHGKGKYFFSNGDFYLGDFYEGMKSGEGIYTFSNGDEYRGEFRHDKINGHGTFIFATGEKYDGGFHDGLRSGLGVLFKTDGDYQRGFWEKGVLVKEAYFPFEKKYENSINASLQNIQRSATNQEENKLTDERRRTPEDKRRHEQQRQSKSLRLSTSNSQPSNDGSFNITIQTNADTASLKVNGEEQGGRADGNYTIKRVARVGQDTQFTITAVDVYGNSDSKTITVTRQAAPAADTSIALKPEAIKRAPARDAVAIIIGIQDYKRVPKAEFANNDAKEFYEYAIRALGIKQEKIKMLLDDEADEVNIVKAFENWLPIQVNKDKTDVYVFYSGHGLPAPDGKSLYFLPHGVDKELLSRTAVGQNEIVAALSAAKPKSVTMFIDACYSGQTRGGDVLVANAKPLSLKSDTNAYPPNFTVITASANDQISSSSSELKHGIFSFYLMKGMEGEADTNKDGKITVGEMQDYLSDKVARQATTLGRKQTTQLVGDSSRVLVAR